jgi:hypothetical protein
MPFKSLKAQRAYNKAYRLKHHERLNNGKLSYWKRQRLQVLEHYSKGKIECACCGDQTYEFLGVDHINGGGNAHRKKLKSKYILSWLVQNNFPTGYQVLCHNCNLAKGFYGKCPHKRSIKEHQAADLLLLEAHSQIA